MLMAVLRAVLVAAYGLFAVMAVVVAVAHPLRKRPQGL